MYPTKRHLGPRIAAGNRVFGKFNASTDIKVTVLAAGRSAELPVKLGYNLGHFSVVQAAHASVFDSFGFCQRIGKR
jgi:hypothetical protein